MSNLLVKTAAVLGEVRAAYDAPLLKLLPGTTDSLDRTRSMSGFTYVGSQGPQWLSFDQKLSRDQYQGVVFLIISSILRKANDIPWGVFRPGKKDERAALVEAEHPLNSFIWRPNPGQSWADVIEELGGFLLLTGNTYGHCVIPRFGTRKNQIEELHPLPAHRTAPLPGEKYLDPLRGYKFAENDGKYTRYEPEQMLHIRYWNPDSRHLGLSPLQAMAKMVTSADSGLNAQVRQFQNQGPAGIVYDESSTEAWTADQTSTVRRWFRSFFPGGRQAGELPIVGGKLGYVKLGLSAADLDILEALQVTTRQLCSGYGYPAELLNDKEASTYNNVSEARKAALTDSVLPHLRRLRDGLNRLIGPGYQDGVYLDLITDNIPELQEDKGKQADALNKSWWVSTQEKQRQMGVEVDESLPKYLIPMGLVPAESLTVPPTEEEDVAPDGE